MGSVEEGEGSEAVVQKRMRVERSQFLFSFPLKIDWFFSQ